MDVDRLCKIVFGAALMWCCAVPAFSQFPQVPEQIPTPLPALSGLNPTAPQLVVGVKIAGNKTTPESKVQQQLRTRPGRDFDPQLVQADVRRLTASGLFRDVRTFTQPTDGGVIVTFEVFERPTIGYVKFVGNQFMRDKTLLKQSDLKEGDALNQFSVEEGRRKVEEYYHTKGFPKTTVQVFEGNQPSDRGVVYIVNEGKLQRISTVVFEGNEIASDGRLKTQIQSKPGFMWYLFGGKVDRKKIDEDIERLTAYYRSLGYFRARISRELEFDDADEWLTLKYIIDEGPRYVVRNVSVIGNERFTSDALLSKLEMHSGEYFNQAKMNRDLSILRDEYGSQGHIFADVQADPRFDEDPGVLDLVYKVKEGDVFRVGKVNVRIEGEFPHTRHHTVIDRLALRPGDIIDIRKVRESEGRLKGSQLFETDPSKGNPPQVVVKPPDLDGMEQSVADRPQPRAGSRSAYRGQSPDEAPPSATTPDAQRNYRSSYYAPYGR